MSRIFFISLFFTCYNLSAQTKEFSLTGKTSGIEDGTFLYFRDLLNGGNLDSAVVKNNSFRFTTVLPEPTLFVMLFTKDKSNFTELWLKNNPMTFDASEGDFRQAKVTGSEDQILFRKMREEVRVDFPETDKKIIKQREIEFMKSHPDALVSAYLLYGNRRLNQDETREIFSGFSKEIQRSSLGQRTAEYLQREVPEVGDQYVDFSIPNIHGDDTKFSDLKEGFTLLQFWSSGCGVSRNMNSALSELYTNYNASGFQLISVSEDRNRELWLQAIKEDKLSWPPGSNLNTADGEVFRTYGVQATPGNFLINEEGIIVAKNLRGEELEKTIQEYVTD